MNATRRTVALGALLVAAGLGSASPALAETPEGNYNLTVTGSSGAIHTRVGDVIPVVLSPCGPDCLHMANPGEPTTDKDYHLQGDAWVSVRGECTYRINANLAMTADCPEPMSLHTTYQLAKTG